MAKKRVDCMLAYPFEAKRLAKYPKPYIVQPKLDGDRARDLMVSGSSSLLSSTAELITGVPHISEVFDYIAKKGIEREIDGELYCHGMDQAKINGIVKRKYIDNLHPEFAKIKFYLFDMINDDIQLKRLEQTRDFYDSIKSSGVVELVPYDIVDTYDEVIALFNKYSEIDGYEGIIVRSITARYKRSRSTDMMKFKVKKKDYYKIVSVNEAISKDGTPLGMLGAFVCEDTMGSTFNVGAGQLSHAQREAHWWNREMLPGRWCKVGYQNLTAKRKVPRSGLCINVSVTKENPEED